MENIQKYVVTVIAAALICGMLPELLQSGMVKDLTKVVCGLALMLTLMYRFRSIDLTIPDNFFYYDEKNVKIAVSEGTTLAQDAAAHIIKDETEAYILDKAAQMNVQIDVDVSVSAHSPLVPISVKIIGDISPQIRSELQRFISVQLNIPKEDQTWIE